MFLKKLVACGVKRWTSRQTENARRGLCAGGARCPLHVELKRAPHPSGIGARGGGGGRLLRGFNRSGPTERATSFVLTRAGTGWHAGAAMGLKQRFPRWFSLWHDESCLQRHITSMSKVLLEKLRAGHKSCKRDPGKHHVYSSTTPLSLAARGSLRATRSSASTREPGDRFTKGPAKCRRCRRFRGNCKVRSGYNAPDTLVRATRQGGDQIWLWLWGPRAPSCRGKGGPRGPSVPPLAGMAAEHSNARHGALAAERRGFTILHRPLVATLNYSPLPTTQIQLSELESSQFNSGIDFTKQSWLHRLGACASNF